MHNITPDLRGALEAALPDMAPDQAQAARTLIAALAPPVEEPKWPGAPVIAVCSGGIRERLHVRRNDGPNSDWECQYACAAATWRNLINPRPLTPAEYEKYGIPAPCTHGADEKTTQRAEGATP